METIQKLSSTQFLKIYSDQKFRNDIAFAHPCAGKNSLSDHFESSSYPNKYIVTPEQIELAKLERERSCIDTLDKYKYDLLFKGMGTDFIPRWDGDITNHRIRTQFSNRNGRCFFIEIYSTNDNTLHVDSATDLDAEKSFKAKLDDLWKEQSKYPRPSNEYQNLSKQIKEYRNNEPTSNYGDIRRDTRGHKCNQSDIVKLINEVFECDFKRMIIDEYNIVIKDNDIVCSSPPIEYSPIDVMGSEKSTIIQNVIQLQLFE